VQVDIMHKIKTISATAARVKFFGLIDDTANSHEPILITTKRNNAVLIGEDDWNSIQETLYLLSIPGMRESLIESRLAKETDVLSKEEFLRRLAKED
jgi:prevent-host-death family protein